MLCFVVVDICKLNYIFLMKATNNIPKVPISSFEIKKCSLKIFTNNNGTSTYFVMCNTRTA